MRKKQVYKLEITRGDVRRGSCMCTGEGAAGAPGLHRIGGAGEALLE